MIDAEDRKFMKIVGEKAVRVLQRRNPRLWQLFKQRCEDNGEKPEGVLGRYALRFVNSILDGDDFHEDVLSREIRLTRVVKRSSIDNGIDLLKRVRDELMGGESEIDKLIVDFIKSEMEKATTTPLKAIAEEKELKKVTITPELLANLTPEQLEALEKMVKYVKTEKLKSMQLTSKDIEKIVGGEEVEEEKEEEVARQSEGDKGSG